MRKNIGFALAACLLFSGLAGCSMTGSNYYTIDIYSDYIGMEEDLKANGRYTVDLSSSSAMAAVGLKKVGYCYAVKGKDAKIGGMTLADSSFNGKTSTRKAAEGHKYVFEQFAGYYSDGKAIDLTSIQSNCALFATFSDTLLDYVVTVRDPFDEIWFNQRVTYGETASEMKVLDDGASLANLLSAGLEHDPLADKDDYSTWRDAHYYNYTFTYWKFTVDGHKTDTTYEWVYDIDKSRSSTMLTKEQAVSYPFKEATNITPFYEKSYKSYDVNIAYQVRSYDEVNDKYVYTSPVSLGKQTIVYGSPIDFAALGLTGYTCVGEGLNGGNPTRYGDDMDIAEGKLRAKLPGPLCELYSGGYRGVVVDRNNIRFGASVNLIYAKDPAKYELTFHNNYDDATATTKLTVEEGQEFSAPAMSGTLPSGKAFADWAVKDADDNLVPIDLSSIEKSCELFPLLVDASLAGDNGNLTFAFSPDLKGYMVSQVHKDATAVAAADFTCASMPSLYPLRGIESFDGPSGETSQKLTSIVLPDDNEIYWLSHGLFTSLRLSEVTKIDISNSQALELASYAFHNLPRVAEINLPGTLYSVGANLFQNCSSLTKVSIGLTASEVAARIAAKGFDANWAGGYSGTITYAEE